MHLVFQSSSCEDVRSSHDLGVRVCEILAFLPFTVLKSGCYRQARCPSSTQDLHKGDDRGSLLNWSLSRNLCEGLFVESWAKMMFLASTIWGGAPFVIGDVCALKITSLLRDSA
jgi:hypothetical protein